MNVEDYERAKKSFKARRIEFVSGVGLNIEKISDTKVNKFEKCKELGVPEHAFIILSVGELNKNKNHEAIIKALSVINNPSIHYIICGNGPLECYLKNLAKNLV